MCKGSNEQFGMHLFNAMLFICETDNRQLEVKMFQTVKFDSLAVPEI
jgi:hypothetical protein